MKIKASEIQVGDKLGIAKGVVTDVVCMEGPMVQYSDTNEAGTLVGFGQRPAYSVVLLKVELLRGADPNFIGSQQLVRVTHNDWMHGDTEVEVERENHR